MKNKKGLYHINRNRILSPEDISSADLFSTLEKRSHSRSWDAAIRIVDKLIADLEFKPGEYSWAMLASLLGHNGSATLKDANLVWNMCFKAAKQHDEITKKMMGIFVMWRFAHCDGWSAYVKDTGRYDEISEKEITVTCYFRSK